MKTKYAVISGEGETGTMGSISLAVDAARAAIAKAKGEAL